MKRFSVMLAAAIAVWAFTAKAMAFTPISSPDAAYLASTTYIDPSAIPDFTDVTSITDGTLTVSFKDAAGSASLAMNKITAPGSAWGTWSQAPDSQRGAADTLAVFFSNGATAARFVLSSPMNIFGFEAEPNPFSVHTMTARFYDASDNLLGTISRNVNGNAGARLFAASSPTPIAYVVFSSDVDWAVGAFRYGTLGGPAIPEPGTMALFGTGLVAGLLPLRRRLRV
ncbi:MAG: PEP-CTERM sorting domain-containing protein [Armatimonadota bacterium]